MRKSPKKKRSDRDLDRFEDQSSTNKELLRLKDLAEKSTGPRRVALDEEIRRTSKEGKTAG